MEERYRTVEGLGQAEFTISGSKFIGQIRPIDTVSDAETLIDRIDEEYAEATHTVPAYRIRNDPLREWASDDGEPTGSAGKPALNVLQGQELENVAVVVIRYFGGTELGVGGLVRAYSRAVKEAIADAGVHEQRPQERISIEVGYDDSGTVRGILQSEEADFEARYEETVEFVVRVPAIETDSLQERIISATSGRATFSKPATDT